MTPFRMATFQAESDQDAIGHPEIMGGKGTYQQESVLLNTAASHRVYVREQPIPWKPTFHSQSTRGAVNHPKIAAGKGIYYQQSAAVPWVNIAASVSQMSASICLHPMQK